MSMNDVCVLCRHQGMGQRIGFGQRPAVLITDMQHDFCDPDAPPTAAAVLEANLFDLVQKYADVVGLSEALGYLERFPLAERASNP